MNHWLKSKILSQSRFTFKVNDVYEQLFQTLPCGAWLVVTKWRTEKEFLLLEFLWLCVVTIAVTGAHMQAKILCWYVHKLQYQYKQCNIIIIFATIISSSLWKYWNCNYNGCV